MGHDYEQHEERFEVKPVGVRYICEFCGEGEMISTNEPVTVIMTDPPQIPMITHICNKCHKTMQLRRSYPYISWEKL